MDSQEENKGYETGRFRGYQGIRKFAKYKGAFVTLTYRCQCRCKHYGVGLFRKRNIKELITEEVKSRILDRLKDCGLDVVYFLGESQRYIKIL